MSLKEAILGLLDSGPKSGYEIKKFYKETIMHFWNVSDGQLYPTLRRMNEDDLIEKRIIKQDATANKNVYNITEKGRDEFYRWLKEPVTKFEEIKEPFLIKLFFFDKLPKDDVIGHLMGQYELHKRILEEFREVKSTYGKEVTYFQNLIIDLGLLYVEIKMFWLLRMIQIIKSDRPLTPLIPDELIELGRKLFFVIFSDAPPIEFFKKGFFNLDIDTKVKEIIREDT